MTMNRDDIYRRQGLGDTSGVGQRCGLIVVDFIDMKSAENRRNIQKIMKDAMTGDKARFTILPLSKFGLMQITRERVRPQMNIATMEVCPSCNGSGKITPTILISDLVEQNIDHLLTLQNEKKLVLAVHPYLHSFFTKGIFSLRVKWFLKYKRWVQIVADSSLGITEYQFLNQEGEEIQINKII